MAMHILSTTLLFSVALGLASCSHAPPTPAVSDATSSTAQKRGWKLVWQDEFDAEGAPDPTRWSYEEGYVRNKEKQFYTRRLENVRVENGTLVIEARRDHFQGHEYTSASLHTKGKGEFKYGRIEARAKLPLGRGLWPAIWTLGTSYGSTHRWPQCGEIDIMEYVGFMPDVIHTTVHTGAYNHRQDTEKGKQTPAKNISQTFNLYAIEWSPEKIDFFFNEQKVFTFANEHKGHDEWPFDEPEYLLLNLAVGGSWGGMHGIDESVFPQAMLVDYVRVYESIP